MVPWYCVADGVASYPDRLRGTVAVTYADAEGSAAEIDRVANRGFCAVMMYARPDLVGSPETETIFAKAAAICGSTKASLLRARR